MDCRPCDGWSRTCDKMSARIFSAEKLRTALAEVRQVYVDLAQRPVERNCIRRTECCHFKLTGRTPYLTKGEAIVAAKALRATGRKSLPENAGGPIARREVVDLIRRLEDV